MTITYLYVLTNITTTININLNIYCIYQFIGQLNSMYINSEALVGLFFDLKAMLNPIEYSNK